MTPPNPLEYEAPRDRVERAYDARADARRYGLVSCACAAGGLAVVAVSLTKMIDKTHLVFGLGLFAGWSSFVLGFFIAVVADTTVGRRRPWPVTVGWALNLLCAAAPIVAAAVVFLAWGGR